MDDVCLIETVLDLTGFDICNSFCYIHRNCAGLRCRHQALRAEDLTKTAELRHHVRCRDESVEIEPVLISDLIDVLFSTYILCASSLSFISLRALSDNEYALCAACTMRENYSTTDLLVSVTGVNTQTNVKLYCLIKLCLTCLLDKLNGLGRIVSY